jgi:hypothetical protein
MTTTNEAYPWSFITTHNTWFTYDYDKRNISMPSILCVMNDHGYVAFVVVIVEPSIMCGNEWSWICCICRSYSWTKYYHIHDHSLPHRIIGSTMSTTNGTYPWSFIATQNTWFKHHYDKWNISMIIHYHTECCLNQVFCVVMNDHGFVSFVVVMVEPSILCGNEWSWICSVCRSHSWTKYSVW